MAISRTREFKADYTAAQITNRPSALASALDKINAYVLSCANKPDPHEERHTATSHMFIISPLTGGVGKWFSSHPPVEERIKRLMALKPFN
jgi:heat shock protein HtpX